MPPYETALAGGDATVYLNFGRQIAHHGALEFEDALLSSLSTDTRAELFLNRVPADVTGRFARFPGGFLIPDIATPTVTAGFSPLFPVLTALFYELFSLRGAFFVAPVFATLSRGGPVARGAASGRPARRVARGHAHGRLGRFSSHRSSRP